MKEVIDQVDFLYVHKYLSFFEADIIVFDVCVCDGEGRREAYSKYPK